MENLIYHFYPGDPLTYFISIMMLQTLKMNGELINSKGILLEDYTGHKCTNCPAAAQNAKDLEQDSF